MNAPCASYIHCTEPSRGRPEMTSQAVLFCGPNAVAVGMAAAASGAVSKIETVRAWTLGEFKGIAEKAARVATSYVPPGR